MNIQTALLELSETPNGKSGRCAIRFAIACAQRVLPIYQNSEDRADRPAQAIQAAMNVVNCIAGSTRRVTRDAARDASAAADDTTYATGSAWAAHAASWAASAAAGSAHAVVRAADAAAEAARAAGQEQNAVHLWQCECLVELAFPTLDVTSHSIVAALFDEWPGSLVELVDIVPQLAGTSVSAQ